MIPRHSLIKFRDRTNIHPKLALGTFKLGVQCSHWSCHWRASFDCEWWWFQGICEHRAWSQLFIGNKESFQYLLRGMLAMVVTPPAAAARVAVQKPSHSVRPGSLMCTWLSTIPREHGQPMSLGVACFEFEGLKWKRRRNTPGMITKSP